MVIPYSSPKCHFIIENWNKKKKKKNLSFKVWNSLFSKSKGLIKFKNTIEDESWLKDPRYSPLLEEVLLLSNKTHEVLGSWDAG